MRLVKSSLAPARSTGLARRAPRCPQRSQRGGKQRQQQRRRRQQQKPYLLTALRSGTLLRVSSPHRHYYRGSRRVSRPADRRSSGALKSSTVWTHDVCVRAEPPPLRVRPPCLSAARRPAAAVRQRVRPLPKYGQRGGVSSPETRPPALSPLFFNGRVFVCAKTFLYGEEEKKYE